MRTKYKFKVKTKYKIVLNNNKCIFIKNHTIFKNVLRLRNCIHGYFNRICNLDPDIQNIQIVQLYNKSDNNKIKKDYKNKLKTVLQQQLPDDIISIVVDYSYYRHYFPVTNICPINIKEIQFITDAYSYPHCFVQIQNIELFLVKYTSDVISVKFIDIYPKSSNNQVNTQTQIYHQFI